MGEIYTNPPQSRNEAILRATIDNTEYSDPPQSRIEDLLLELKEAIEQGAGVAGVSSFNTRTGAVTPAAGDYDAGEITYDNQESDLEATDTQGAIDELAAQKTDKVTGAINGNFAGLNGSGELTDSGSKASDFASADVISTQETGDTATATHKTGTYFLNKNGKFCRAIADISVGETFTLNTNYKTVDVGTELNKTTKIYEASADGIKTYAQMLAPLLPLVLAYKDNDARFNFIIKAVSSSTIQIYYMSAISKTEFTKFARFSSAAEANGTCYNNFFTLQENGCKYVSRNLSNNTTTDFSNEKPDIDTFTIELWLA